MTTFGEAIAPLTKRGYPPGWFIPLVPINARLSQKSRLKPGDTGKIPGVPHADGSWSGRRWQEQLDDERFQQALSWPTPNAGVYAAQLQCIDCDIDNEEVAGVARQVLEEHVPQRVWYRDRDGSPRWAAPVRGLLEKHALIEITNREGKVLGRVEFKTTGQWVVVGKHPAGKHYVWREGIPALSEVPQLPDDRVEGFRQRLTARLEALGLQVTVGSRRARADGGSAGQTGGRRHVRSLPQLLSLATLEQLLEVVPCDQETVGGWDEGVKVLAGFAAVLGSAGWPDAPPALAAWSATYPGTTAEWFGDRWASLEYVDQGSNGFVSWLLGLELEPAARQVVLRATREIRQAEARLDFDAMPDQAGEPDDAPAPGEAPSEVQAALEQLLEEGAARYVYRQHADEWVHVADMTHMSALAFSQSNLGLQLSAAHAAVLRAGERKPGRPPKPLPGSQVLRPRAVSVSGVTYEPGSPEIIDRDGGRLLNRWRAPPRPFKGRVVTDDEVRPFLDLVEHVLPEEADRLLFLDWAAHLAQRPGVKVEWCLVMFSLLQGTGKDTLLRAVWAGVVGARNWSVVQLQELTSSNNGHWAESHVVLVIELPGGRQRDAIAILKGLVASVAGARIVNPKYVTPYSIADRICWAATTNHPDAVDLTDDDRRIAVLAAREERLPREMAERVHAFYDIDGKGEGAALVGEWLHQRRISAAFDAKRCPPSSKAKETMRRHGLDGTPAEQLLERLTQGEAEGSLAGRRLLWGREVQQAMDAARGQTRWHGRRGHLPAAMDMAGWRLHPKAGEDGRLTVAGPRREGEKRRYVAIAVWVKKDDEVVLGCEPRAVLELLHDDLREHRNDLGETLGQLLAQVNDAGAAEGDEAPVDLEARRKERAARKPSWL